MKMTFNKYWILISLGIIANIFIFIFMSTKLESFVVGNIEDSQYYVPE